MVHFVHTVILLISQPKEMDVLKLKMSIEHHIIGMYICSKILC
jgi:hypothetical protein